jgi:hypothetical protein
MHLGAAASVDRRSQRAAPFAWIRASRPRCRGRPKGTKSSRRRVGRGDARRSSFGRVSALIADTPATRISVGGVCTRRRDPWRGMARQPASASEIGGRGGRLRAAPCAPSAWRSGRSRRSADRSSPAHATTRTRGRDSAHAFADRSAWVAQPLAPAQPRRLEMSGQRDRSGPGSHKAVRTKARLTRRTPPKIIAPTRAKRRSHG